MLSQNKSNIIMTENESNVDANSLLTELDKGLRSINVGQQCESIVRFPWLFERYPFPILINSAVLKLSEVYRNGSNFLRVLILQVMAESEKHLDKIVNIDELVRRLFSVTYSNDCTARTITLRTLATIARIVANRKNIHHYIRNSLDSNDEMEVLAAIEAAACFADKSKEFAANIYPKIVLMINGLTTPLEIKIKLLSVLNNVHYNCEIADDVRLNCIKFLPIYPSEKFVSADLHTLTQIASTSLTQIPDQVQLLLQYFIDDPRHSVKLSVLEDMKYLASMSPHLWQKKSTSVLVDFILAMSDNNNLQNRLLSKSLAVFSQLVSSPTIFADEPQFYSVLCVKMINCCLEIIYSEQNMELISTCMCILTNISINLNSSCIVDIDVIQETCCAMQSYLMSNFNADKTNYSTDEKKSLISIFKCNLSLCQSSKCLSKSQITETLRFILMNDDLNSIWFGMTCETFCAITSIVDMTTNSFSEDIFSLIIKSSQNTDSNINESNFVLLLTIYFQIQSPTKVTEREAELLLNSFKRKNLWTCFKIFRQAMRFGHHLIASLLIQKIKEYMEPIETIHFWINSLSHISIAESYISKSNEDIDKTLCTAISLYIEGLTDLKASISQSNPMRFECEFVKLRLKYLQTHYYFRQCCKLLKTSPPPANSAAIALSTRDDMLICGNIVIVMRKSAKEFRALAESYSLLYQSSFNADDQTLAQIQLLQHSAIILAEAIESLFQSNRLNSLFVPKDTPFQGDSNRSTFSSPLEHRAFIQMCSKLSNLIHSELSALKSSELIGNKQISLLLTISSQILKVSLCFPRYFFQVIQNTCIKLAISPQPKSGDLLIINNSTHFCLRIEGVVVNNNKCKKLNRKVGKVLICVNSLLISRSGSVNDHISKNNCSESNLSLQSVVVPFNDYFQVQFLLSLTITGMYSINIETSIIDDNEAQWKSGPNISFNAKVIEDMSCK